MKWQVGQQVRCDRPENLLPDCLVVATEPDSVKIICPAAGFVVSGQQDRLEEMGWRAIETESPSFTQPVLLTQQNN